MKITLCLFTAFMLSACSAPKYTYYFSHANDPAEGAVKVSQDPAFQIHPESVQAYIETVPVTVAPIKTTASAEFNEDIDKNASNPAYDKQANKKEARQALKLIVKDLRKARKENISSTPSNETRSANAKNNGFAIAGFVLSILGWFVLWPLIILGVIFSAIGLNSEKKGLAIAGIIIGIVGLIILLVAAQSGVFA